MIRYFFTRQFLGYLAVGGVAALLHWLARVVLSVWMPFTWAVVFAYSVGVSVAFVLNSLFVFSRSAKAKHKQARDFVIVNLAFLPIVWYASILLNDALRQMGMMRYTEELAHGMALAIPMFATFLIYKFFAFRDAAFKSR
ncbi:MAG: GtrA family protein [Rhodocyclales bacterium]|nr:GtrA family protein [Rhodocyclales bacterium]